MTRTLRAVARVLTAALLLAALIAVPVVVVFTVGVPAPSWAQLRAAWSGGRIDDELVLRLGAAVFTVLWLWFAVTAVADLWRVLQWQRAGRRRPLRPVAPGPAGWVHSLVRFVAISSATAGAAFGSLAHTTSSAAGFTAVALPAAVAPPSAEAQEVVAPVTVFGTIDRVTSSGRETPFSLAVRAGDPSLREPIIELNRGRVAPDGSEWSGGVFPAGMEVLLPGEATVLTPLGPAHEVEVGDCYWDIADRHLGAVLDHEPTPADVLAYSQRLIALNDPLLGHRDATLLLPGELVVLPDAQPDVVVVPEVRVPEVGVPDVQLHEVPTADHGAPPPPLAATDTAGSAPQPGPDTKPDPVVIVVERDGTAPFMAGLGTALLLSAGGLGLLDAKRRRRLRAAAVGARLDRPLSAAVEVERELRSYAAAERVARLDLALRAAAPALAAQGALVTAAVLGDDGGVRLHLRGAATPTDGLWRLDPHQGTWLLDSAVDTVQLAPIARASVHPCPALVHLGGVAGGDLFVDLEAIGVLSVESPQAEAILRAMAASIDLSPFVDTGRVLLVGDDTDPAEDAGGDLRTDRLDDLDAALDAAAVALGSTAAVARGRSTFSLRVNGTGGEAWEPVVVVAVQPGSPSAVAALVRAARPGTGLGAAVQGPVPAAEWVLRATGSTHVLQPLGVQVHPVGLDAASVAAVRQLLIAEDEPLPAIAHAVPLRAVAIGESPAAPATQPTPFVEPDWSLLVRVFGHVEVIDREGRAAAFERSKATELVVWLTQHRERPTRHAARNALWDVEVRDATFANVVSDARRAMARAVTPADGEEWIARTLTDDLPLHAGVRADAELVARRVTHARDLSPAAAVDVLRPAVELLAGMPFAGTGYLWCDAEGLSSSLALLAVEAAGAMAQHCLALGDTDGVFWATGQGLKVIGGHEALVALRMRAHARRGDLAGVRSEWESYERALAADTFLTPEPSAKLVALRHELLGRAPARAAEGASA